MSLTYVSEEAIEEYIKDTFAITPSEEVVREIAEKVDEEVSEFISFSIINVTNNHIKGESHV